MDSSVLEWLRQMAGVGQGGGPPITPMGPGSYGAAPVGPMQQSQDPRFGGIAPQSPPPGGYPFMGGPTELPATPQPGIFTPPSGQVQPPRSGDPMWKPWDFSQGLDQMVPGAPPAPGSVPPGTGMMAFPGPQTKTDQRAPLQFAWGSNTPENYQPGVSKILEMQGAPEGRQGFMGVTPQDPSQSGGYGPSQQDWSKVANPAGFESFQQAPQVEDTLRSLDDPMWQQQREADIAQAQQIAVGESLIQKESDVQIDRMQKMQAMLYEEYTDAQMQENKRRADAGQPPMTEEEEQDLYSTLQARMTGIDPLTGKSTMGG